MNALIFVQNVKSLCKIKGIKPTIACEQSGAGKNLLNHIETRGSIPSVEKVQLLANYLGVTTSELLGEEIKKTAAETGDGQAEKLAKALQEIGINVDKLSEADIIRIAKLAKVALEE